MEHAQHQVIDETFLVGETTDGTIALHPDVWDEKKRYTLCGGERWKKCRRWHARLDEAKRQAIELCEEYLDSQDTEDESSLKKRQSDIISKIESQDGPFLIDVDDNFRIHCREAAAPNPPQKMHATRDEQQQEAGILLGRLLAAIDSKEAAIITRTMKRLGEIEQEMVPQDRQDLQRFLNMVSAEVDRAKH